MGLGLAVHQAARAAAHRGPQQPRPFAHGGVHGHDARGVFDPHGPRWQLRQDGRQQRGGCRGHRACHRIGLGPAGGTHGASKRRLVDLLHKDLGGGRPKRLGPAAQSDATSASPRGAEMMPTKGV